MKANKLFLLASLLLSGSMIPITAQNKKEKKQQREQAVREAVDAKAYKINVDRVMPMKGGSKHLTPIILEKEERIRSIAICLISEWRRTFLTEVEKH